MIERIDREVIGGHLLVIGGAEDKYNERRILKKFLSLAGEEKAEVLIVPVASDFPEFAADVYTQAFRNLGIREPARVAGDFAAGRFSTPTPEELLDGVTGVFITGGDQMRLVSLLGGTRFATKLRHMVAKNGYCGGGNERRGGRDEHVDDRPRRIDPAPAQEFGAAFARARVSEKHHYRPAFYRARPDQPAGYGRLV